MPTGVYKRGKKSNGVTPPRVSEKERIEDGIRQLHARLQDIQTRERYKKELVEFLSKRPLLTRFDVAQAAIEALKPKRPVRGNLEKIAQAEKQTGTNRRGPTEEAKEKFGKALKAWRTENNITTDDLGKKLKVHFTTISSWERGASSPKKDLLPTVTKLTGLELT